MNIINKFFGSVARLFSLAKRRRRQLLADEEYDSWIGI